MMATRRFVWLKLPSASRRGRPASAGASRRGIGRDRRSGAILRPSRSCPAGPPPQGPPTPGLNAVRCILRKHDYPPDKQEKATLTVLEQAEVLSEGWAD